MLLLLLVPIEGLRLRLQALMLKLLVCCLLLKASALSGDALTFSFDVCSLCTSSSSRREAGTEHVIATPSASPHGGRGCPSSSSRRRNPTSPTATRTPWCIRSKPALFSDEVGNLMERREVTPQGREGGDTELCVDTHVHINTRQGSSSDESFKSGLQKNGRAMWLERSYKGAECVSELARLVELRSILMGMLEGTYVELLGGGLRRW